MWRIRRFFGTQISSQIINLCKSFLKMWFSGVSVLSAKTSYCQKWILNLFSVENVVEGFREKLVSARNIGKNRFCEKCMKPKKYTRRGVKSSVDRVREKGLSDKSYILGKLEFWVNWKYFQFVFYFQFTKIGNFHFNKHFQFAYSRMNVWTLGKPVLVHCDLSYHSSTETCWRKKIFRYLIYVQNLIYGQSFFLIYVQKCLIYVQFVIYVQNCP